MRREWEEGERSLPTRLILAQIMLPVCVHMFMVSFLWSTLSLLYSSLTRLIQPVVTRIFHIGVSMFCVSIVQVVSGITWSLRPGHQEVVYRCSQIPDDLVHDEDMFGWYQGTSRVDFWEETFGHPSSLPTFRSSCSFTVLA